GDGEDLEALGGRAVVHLDDASGEFDAADVSQVLVPPWGVRPVLLPDWVLDARMRFLTGACFALGLGPTWARTGRGTPRARRGGGSRRVRGHRRSGRGA